MKRHRVWVVFGISMLAWLNPATGQDLNVNECQIVKGFYTLWEKSFFGREPNRVEAGAWVRLNGNSEYEFILWEITPERERVSWREGFMPEKVVAQAHTHPQKVDPKPSKPDIALAKRLNLPIYTISRKGIWKVDPDGVIHQVTGLQWYKALDSCNQQAQATTGQK